eukprot:TRINITY_DN50021_c0_g1_i1.p1 TRINITY_DN50021_c0_g1~~TRINITY_DN50021_c0_g1_i1.p1  ORF type:complete len:183 (+),score=69.96 TRINITY_DN50021_c0_g1_i1:80-550(+)
MPAIGECLSDPKRLVVAAAAAAGALYWLLSGSDAGKPKANSDGQNALQGSTVNEDRPDRTYTEAKFQRMMAGLLTKERKSVTKEEWAKHTDIDKSLWILVGGMLFEVATFHEMHPGGTQIYLELKCPVDATQSYLAIGHSDRALKEMAALYVGHLA